jgi:hypothetical protein
MKPNVQFRCQHRSSAGRQCRFRASGQDSRLCSRHDSMERHSAEVTADLTSDLGDLTSAAAINDFLRRLLLLLAQDRISTRRAAVLAYITSQLLRTISAINKEAEDDAPKDTRPTIVWNIPGPERENANQPS